MHITQKLENVLISPVECYFFVEGLVFFVLLYMQPNKVIEIMLPDIVKMCRFISRNNELQHDLVNEVVLQLLENKRIVQIYEKEDAYNYAFRVAYCTWNNTPSKQSFKALYRDYDIINCVDVSNLKYKLKQEDEDTTFDLVKESINKLKNGIQKQTIEKYISLGCNLKELSSEVGVSRYQLKKFINETCKQIKTIYDRSN